MMPHFGVVQAGNALSIVAVLLIAGLGSSARATPVSYSFTGVVSGNDDPVNPAGTIQAFTYISPSGFITSELSLTLSDLTACTDCNSTYIQGQFPVEIAPGFDGFDSIEFINYNLTPQGFQGTVSQENYSFDLGAFSTVGTYSRATLGGANPATLTVAAIPEPATLLLVAAPSMLYFLRHRRRSNA